MELLDNKLTKKKHLGVLLDLAYFEKLKVLMKFYRQVSLTHTVRLIIEDRYRQVLGIEIEVDEGKTNV